jgi:hypothetical protein
VRSSQSPPSSQPKHHGTWHVAPLRGADRPTFPHHHLTQTRVWLAALADAHSTEHGTWPLAGQTVRTFAYVHERTRTYADIRKWPATQGEAGLGLNPNDSLHGPRTVEDHRALRLTYPMPQESQPNQRAPCPRLPPTPYASGPTQAATRSLSEGVPKSPPPGVPPASGSGSQLRHSALLSIPTTPHRLASGSLRSQTLTQHGRNMARGPPAGGRSANPSPITTSTQALTPPTMG